MKQPVLAIDFGGSFTTGASRVNDLDEPTASRDFPDLPSAVFVGPDGRLTAGGTAEELAEAFPDRIVHDLRHLMITRESVRVADRDVPTVALAAASLRQAMLDAARKREVERFDRVVLTYPTRWGPDQVKALGQAAAEAGLPQPWFVTEAEAVIAFHNPPPGTTVAVYDLGGRSLGIAVARRTEQGPEILDGTAGHERFGGGDLDQALLRIVAKQAERLDVAAWDALNARHGGPKLLADEIVQAKHTLSDQPSASLQLDGLPEAITVTRAEFEDATDQMLRWSVAELLAAIRRAGLSPADLAAVYLAGAATRMPRIAALITEGLGRAPVPAADPGTVVALGGLRAHEQAPPLPAQAAAPPVPDVRSVPTQAVPTPVRGSGPRLRRPYLAVVAMIPVTALVIAGSFFLRSHLGPSTNSGSSSATTTPPGALPGSSAPALPPPTISVSDTPTSADPSVDPSVSPEESPTLQDEPGIAEGSYSVSLSGTVSGQSFERTAQLQVMSTVARDGTTNGVNEIEVCLRSGFPAGTPEVGAIWFGTNTACFPERGAKLDMATVEVSGDTVTLQPDGQVAAAGLNQFTASGNYIYACLYRPVSGSMTLTFSGGSPSGEINIDGYSGPCQAAGTNTTYTAHITG